MSSPLPLRRPVDHTTTSRSIAGLTDDATGAVLEALASETARAIVAAVDDDPATASDIADRVDTSLQNVQYHLSSLVEADLVTDVGTWYSSRGKEMTVYAPTFDRLEFRLRDASNDRPGAPERSASEATPAAGLND